jgi:UDP-N-acetylglucosamine 4,6-dehydratase/5-epimerase
MSGPDLSGSIVLVTGGTGSFGHAFVRHVLDHHQPAAVRIFSRDELKQWEMQRRFGDDPRLRFLIGDVRDGDRLRRAFDGVDVVVHAAALKHVPVCEYNPFEAVQTNVIGAENVVSAAIDAAVPRTIALSTDKAVNPVNLYGATKLCAEKIVAQGNAYSGGSVARFASVRYGNVVGSRGSVVPLFLEQAKSGSVTITDESMTRFWITLDQSVRFVLECLGRMEGGETFVPKIPSARILDIADAVAPGAERRLIGIRPGEKLHEVLLTADEARHTAEFDTYYAIYPSFPSWRSTPYPAGKEVPAGATYSSDTNAQWLDTEGIRALIETDASG